MALSMSLRPSADAGNSLVLGSDAGLWSPVPISPRGGPYGMVIDNSFAAAGAPATYYYALPSQQTGQVLSGVLGQAVVFPLMVTRDAQAVSVHGWCTTAVAGATSAVFNTLYSPDATTGQPAAKVTDWFTVPMTATGLTPATMNATPTLSAYVQYWVASWFGVAGAAVSARNGGAAMPLRHHSATAAPLPNLNIALLHNSTTVWPTTGVGPASATTYFTSPAYAQVAPFYWWGLKNV